MIYDTRNANITNDTKIQLVVPKGGTGWNSGWVLFSDLDFNLDVPIEISYNAFFTEFYRTAPNHFIGLIQDKYKSQTDATYHIPAYGFSDAGIFISYNLEQPASNTWHNMKYIINFSSNSIIVYVDNAVYKNLTIPTYLNTSSVLRLILGVGVYNYNSSDVYDNILIKNNFRFYLIQENNNYYSIKEENYNSETGIYNPILIPNSNPIISDFNNYGMTDLSLINSNNIDNFIQNKFNINILT